MSFETNPHRARHTMQYVQQQQPYNEHCPTSHNMVMYVNSYANPYVYQAPWPNMNNNPNNYGCLPLMHNAQTYQPLRQLSIDLNSTYSTYSMCSRPHTEQQSNSAEVNNVNNYKNNSYNQTTYKYMATKLIGSGTFGEIWNVIEKYDINCKQQKQRRYAIKMIKNSSKWEVVRRKKYEQIFLNEGRRIIHLNSMETNEVGKHLIIKCKELLYCTNENNNNPILNLFTESPLIGPCIVMQLCGYSLSQYITFNECTNSTVSLSTIRCIAAQIFFAMSFIHGVGACIHSDLKPENILIRYSDCYNSKNNKIVSKHPNIKIVDFGNAIDVNKKLKSFNIQSLWYRSPELLLGNFEEISTLVDMWSIGCILFELTSLSNYNLHCNRIQRKRLFTSGKLNTDHVIYKIAEKLSTFPQYVYNTDKSYHFSRYYRHVVCHNESSYVKLKNQRKVELLKNLEFGANGAKQEEFMCLMDLLACLLDLNPLTRYSSEDAVRHKFTVYHYKNKNQYKIHPVIKLRDDDERQKRIDIQINECRVRTGEGRKNMNRDSFPLTFAKQQL